MRLKTAVIAALAVVAVVTAAVVLAEEKTEDVATLEAAELRPPTGEWIPSVPGATATVWAVGDAEGPGLADVARLIRRADPDRILYVGDVYPKGSRDDFARWAKPWGHLVRRMAPTPGNHEWAAAREGYEPFWRKVTGEKPPTYYSFKAGGWEVLSLNTEHSEWRPAKKWIKDKVEAGGDCRIAFWHRPPYSAGKYKDGDRVAREFWQALRGGARIVVNGHDHNMQRLRRRDRRTQFISGAGGRHRYDVDEGDQILAFGDDQHFGALRLRLSQGFAEWRFVATNGRVLDSGSLDCRAPE